jgi:putative heme-binding domain-containing protein
MNSAVRMTRELGAALALVTFFSFVMADGPDDRVYGQEAEWIWSPTTNANSQPNGISYFRKSFTLRGPQSGQIEMTCDSKYTLFVNGVRVGGGQDWNTLDLYNISPYLINGSNVIAVEGLTDSVGAAGMVARVTFKDSAGNATASHSNSTWKTNTRRQAGWQQPGFNDRRWVRAKSIGKFGTTPPWNATPKVAAEPNKPRFEVTREFRVEWIIKPEQAGSLIAMSFDEFGNVIASRENGPLLLIRDTNKDGLPDNVSTYCKEVTNCQGILPMNGKVYVTADGPDGCALYRLADSNRDAKIDTIEPIIKFKGKMQEHGPHGLRLGPDGLIYLVCGNMTEFDHKFSDKSPHRFSYEGDLVQPRHEDPRGHAAGVKAPGSTILRMDPEGKVVERFVGGLRNPYDITFNGEGELFTWDADMEWDRGLTWHRPTRITHLVPGGEYGWRSGWAKWPSYFIDSLPGISDTGPGSPTGAVCYDHVMYPVRFHGALFMGDWAQGQILVARLDRKGGSYTAQASVFLEGNPLNVTDLEVGPDGWLYFCTGGRGTEGGIYRIIWTGEVPPEVKDLGTGIQVALRQPQLHTAWARQRIAVVRKELGDQWDTQLIAAARNRVTDTKTRIRALNLMQLYGPFPKAELLVELAADRDRQVRAKAAKMMGIHVSEESTTQLVALLDDPDPVVRRRACESLAQGGYELPAAKLIELLASEDRYLAWAAAKTLQQAPTEHWQDAILNSKNQRVVIVGSSALLSADPSAETCKDVLNAMQTLMRGFVADRDFNDLLRVCQLALHRGEIKPEDVPEFANEIAEEFPAGDPIMNRELVRVLAYLKSTVAAERFLEHFNSDIDKTDKLHLAVHAPHFVGGWTQEQKFELLEYFAKERNEPAGETYSRYLDRVARQFVEVMDEDERIAVLAEGDKWPAAALGALAKLPPNPGGEVIEYLKLMDAEIAGKEGEDVEQLRIGVVAVLARSKDTAAMTYLRELFEKEPDRRAVLAMGLAQIPEGENWPLLVRALPVVEGRMAGEVLKQLATVDEAPADAAYIRNLILFGLRHENKVLRQRTIALLEHWTGDTVGKPEASQADIMADWQTWFSDNYPDEPAANLPVAAETDKYTFDQLYGHLTSEQGQRGDIANGAIVFKSANCAKCHRFGGQGNDLGPDLTTINRRFHSKEILESIVFPSHVISSQYLAKTVTTVEGQIIAGLVVPQPNGSVVVFDSEGRSSRIAKEEIDEIQPSKISSMPAGLLNELTLHEIADLFAYMKQAPRQNIARQPEE